MRPELERIYQETLSILPRCIMCGKPIQQLYRRKYCSDECKRAMNRLKSRAHIKAYTRNYRHRNVSTRMTILCPICGEQGYLHQRLTTNSRTGNTCLQYHVVHYRHDRTTTHYIRKSDWSRVIE